MAEWISVKKRLPPEKKFVMCYLDYSDKPAKLRQRVGWLKKYSYGAIFVVPHDDGDPYKRDWTVTHWMPLPEPPKTEDV